MGIYVPVYVKRKIYYYTIQFPRSIITLLFYLLLLFFNNIIITVLSMY